MRHKQTIKYKKIKQIRKLSYMDTINRLPLSAQSLHSFVELVFMHITKSLIKSTSNCRHWINHNYQFDSLVPGPGPCTDTTFSRMCKKLAIYKNLKE